jgi:hypothetical protein
MRCKNVASPDNSLASRRSPDFVTTVAGRSPMDRMAEGIEHMVIETVLLIAFVAIVGAAIVKAYEWYRDILYGPYMKRVD